MEYELALQHLTESQQDAVWKFLFRCEDMSRNRDHFLQVSLANRAIVIIAVPTVLVVYQSSFDDIHL